MGNLNDILNKVSEISKSDNGVGEQINMISETYDINHKISTALHFAVKDGDWNPIALEVLSEITKELPINEVTIDSNYKKEFDFYMINYLNDNWREQIIDRIKKYEELSFFNVWMRSITGMVIDDLEKVGKYPKEETNFTINRHFPGDGMVYDVVSDWYENILDEVLKTKNS
tara:strand:+ start:83 stop:598 length:516 start_codon:yes stop_codon:yes gene_type:complete